MNKIDYSTPLKHGSRVCFQINGCAYNGIVTSSPLEDCYVCITEMIKDGKSTPIEGNRKPIVWCIFYAFGYDYPEDCYKEILGKDKFPAGKIWPESSLEDLEKVLSHMKRVSECTSKKREIKEKPGEGLLRSEYFRFRVGDTINYKNIPHKIIGYYFLGGFNNYHSVYGYVIYGPQGSHDGSRYGYDMYGKRLTPTSRCDCWYINEASAEVLTINNKQKIKKDGNEIKLQRTKAVIRRGEVPKGCRICSKIHKTAISVKPLSNTAIFGDR